MTQLPNDMTTQAGGITRDSLLLARRLANSQQLQRVDEQPVISHQTLEDLRRLEGQQQQTYWLGAYRNWPPAERRLFLTARIPVSLHPHTGNPAGDDHLTDTLLDEVDQAVQQLEVSPEATLGQFSEAIAACYWELLDRIPLLLRPLRRRIEDPTGYSRAYRQYAAASDGERQYAVHTWLQQEMAHRGLASPDRERSRRLAHQLLENGESRRSLDLRVQLREWVRSAGGWPRPTVQRDTVLRPVYNPVLAAARALYATQTEREFTNQYLGEPWTAHEAHEPVRPVAEQSTRNDQMDGASGVLAWAELPGGGQLNMRVPESLLGGTISPTISSVGQVAADLVATNALPTTGFVSTAHNLGGVDPGQDETRRRQLAELAESEAASTPLTAEQAEMISRDVFDRLTDGDSPAAREAAAAVNDFTRVRMREEGVFRQIMPPMPEFSPYAIEQARIILQSGYALRVMYELGNPEPLWVAGRHHRRETQQWTDADVREAMRAALAVIQRPEPAHEGQLSSVEPFVWTQQTRDMQGRDITATITANRNSQGDVIGEIRAQGSSTHVRNIYPPQRFEDYLRQNQLQQEMVTPAEQPARSFQEILSNLRELLRAGQLYGMRTQIELFLQDLERAHAAELTPTAPAHEGPPRRKSRRLMPRA